MSDIVNKAKTFWEKPEGKTGMIFAAGGIIGALLIMMKWGAAIVAAAANTFVLGMYVLAACVIGYVLMDPRFRATMFYLYKGTMRAITGLIVQIDPIAILKSYVDDLKSNHENMDKQIQKLRGVLSSLMRRIKENESLAKSQMDLAAQAKKQGVQAQVMLKTRKAGRLQESNRTYKELHTKVEMIYRVLTKMYTSCGILIEDTEDSIAQKETEWKTVKMANGAMKSAMSIINGDKDKRAIYEEALEFMANDLDNKIGEMERFQELSQNFLDGVDLQNGVFEEKGLEMLEKWEKDADSWLLGDEKPQIIKDSADDNKVLDVDAPVEAPERRVRLNQYNGLFDK